MFISISSQIRDTVPVSLSLKHHHMKVTTRQTGTFGKQCSTHRMSSWSWMIFACGLSLFMAWTSRRLLACSRLEHSAFAYVIFWRRRQMVCPYVSKCCKWLHRSVKNQNHWDLITTMSKIMHPDNRGSWDVEINAWQKNGATLIFAYYTC